MRAPALGQDVQLPVLGQQLHLDRLANLAPGQAHKRLLQPRQAPLGGADQVMHRRLAPTHRRQRLLGRNPPVHDPHPLGPAVLRLDLRQELRQRRFVAGVARHHLVGQRKPFRGHDQRDHHLHAVRALVAAVAELALARKRRVAFKIGGSDIVESKGTLQFDRLIARPVRKRVLS